MLGQCSPSETFETEEMSSVESESDGDDGCAKFRGTIQPYMFEPKMDISEAAVRDAEKVTAQAEVKERRPKVTEAPHWQKTGLNT